MEEIWNNKGLVSKEEWSKKIARLKSDTVLHDLDEIKKELKSLLVESIKKRIPSQKFGLLFSGGVDSSTIALVLKQLGADFTCYTVGFQDGETKMPNDVIYAEKVAMEIDVDLKLRVYNLDEAQEIIKETVKILRPVGKADTVGVGVGSVVYAAVELAKKDGIDFFFGGLGSEEIFAGYQRHGEASDINEECWKGLMGMYERDLLRDAALAKALSFGAATPFLDEEMIKFSMQIPGEMKIKNGLKKWILREVALDLGLPKEFAYRKKQGAQYGSGFDKAIAKLSGKMQKGEWLETL